MALTCLVEDVNAFIIYKTRLEFNGHNCKEMLLLRPMMVESLTNDQQKIRLTPNQTKQILVISLLLLLAVKDVSIW